MTSLRHPDIEIYIKNQTSEQIIDWLKAHSKAVVITEKKQNSTYFEIQFSDNNQDIIEVHLQQRVSGKAWSSLWFTRNTTPWDTDIDCAKFASETLDTQIRCIKSGWTDTEDSNDEEQWWKVEGGEAVLIKWQE